MLTCINTCGIVGCRFSVDVEDASGGGAVHRQRTEVARKLSELSLTTTQADDDDNDDVPPIPVPDDTDSDSGGSDSSYWASS